MGELLLTSFFVEQNMAIIAMHRRQFVMAEGHCQRCLAYSRRYGLEGVDETTDILSALRTYFNLRQLQGNLSDALTFAEECYNLVVEAYDPVHPPSAGSCGAIDPYSNREG
jgi:hypothetical protein